MNNRDLVEQEVIDFHKRIEAWFRGNETDKAFALSEILESFHPQFTMSGASGNTLDFKSFAEWLPTAYGSFPDKKVELFDMQIAITEKHGLVEYVESQEANGEATKRKSSAVFIITENGAQWFHLLEKWI